MTYTKQEKLSILERNTKVYTIVISECKKKLPMLKMTYPQCIITNPDLSPNYSKTIKTYREVIMNIKQLKKRLKNKK